MAPPPECDKEPKAPDKTNAVTSSEDSTIITNVVNDHSTNAEAKASNSTANTEIEKNKYVEALDDGQLRALLDEAITYKSPKDREGKSVLFQELLQVVEKDEKECEAAARNFTGTRSSRRSGRNRRALPHSNSLQDLVAALAAESAPRRSRAHANSHAANVSARAIHGGSLPSGVDTTFLAYEEPVSVRKEYVATVQCVNPSPHVERRVSASDAHNAQEMEQLNRSKSVFPMTYTARATLEIGSGSVSTGRAVTTTTASNQVDSAISFSCITTPEVVASCNTTSSTSQSTAVAVDAKCSNVDGCKTRLLDEVCVVQPLQLGSCYRAVASLGGHPATWQQLRVAVPHALVTSAATLTTARHDQSRTVVSSSNNGLPLSRPGYGSTNNTTSDEHKRSLDENGNSMHGFSSPLSGSSQHKKPRRKKSSKNETVINVNQIDGYQGTKDLNELVRYIEAAGGLGQKIGRAKHKDDSDDKGGKKRSTERRKDKENKMKRATSMEELSRTKLEDLTDKPEPTLRKSKKERRSEGAAPAKPERRSWGDDTRGAFYYRDVAPSDPSVDGVELTDFQTVTKRRKPRRRPDEPAPRVPRAPSPRAPPSDRSNDSNDDVDSVHSLPPDAPHTRIAQPTHASYADIARTRHNIPDLIESCNYYVEGDSDARLTARVLAPPAVDTDHDPDVDSYPALDTKVSTGVRRRDGTPAVVPSAVVTTAMRRERKERADCAPDVVGDRRPAVILMDAATRPRDMDGVTFGFDIDEQLVCGGTRRARCDLLRHAADECDAVRVTCGVRGDCTVRYVSPTTPCDTAHHQQIVEFVGSAWDDVIRGGKVKYYSDSM